ncbi:UNKNOWN [Stylonychia lemnae]|uniref:Uncharacterized protein n=1 Tax=Stylonychia lemnae TaxID=5949 RepID=A0A077ZX03_STYLE|nr:UNKNOWN [Stylonychia lemnae]|eukprot:CDW74400.1 UNKNOWN [Stylonychia lemnae]
MVKIFNQSQLQSQHHSNQINQKENQLIQRILGLFDSQNNTIKNLKLKQIAQNLIDENIHLGHNNDLINAIFELLDQKLLIQIKDSFRLPYQIQGGQNQQNIKDKQGLIDEEVKKELDQEIIQVGKQQNKLEKAQNKITKIKNEKKIQPKNDKILQPHTPLTTTQNGKVRLMKYKKQMNIIDDIPNEKLQQVQNQQKHHKVIYKAKIGKFKPGLKNLLGFCNEIESRSQ